jgi:hypothetical protein
MSLLIVLYEFGILPFLLGMLWCQKEKKMGFHRIYVQGYMTMFALFWVIAVPLIHQGRSLSQLAAAWTVVSIAAPVLAAVKILVDTKMLRDERGKAAVKEELAYLAANFRFACRNMKGLLGLAAVLMAVSIFFIAPSAKDDTPEIAGVSVQSDTMYVYQPYTYIPYEDNSEGANSPLAMIYAVAARLSGMNPTTLIHWGVPVFLLLLYAAVGWFAAAVLFPAEWMQKRLFTDLWLVTGTVVAGANRALSVGIYQNIWNGVTLVAAVILPLAMAESVALLTEFSDSRKFRLRGILLLAATALAAQLAIKNGILLAALAFIMCACGALIREGIRYVGKH